MKFIQINRARDPSEEVAKAAVARLAPTHGCKHGDVSGWRQCHQAILGVVGEAVASIQARMTGEHSRPWCLRSWRGVDPMEECMNDRGSPAMPLTGQPGTGEEECCARTAKEHWVS